MNAALARGSLLACAVAVVACGGHAAGASSGGTSASTDAPSTDAVTTAAAARSVPDGDWTQFNYNAQRTGVGPANTGINARDLGRLQLRLVHVDGTVDSSAIAFANVKVRGHRRDVLIMTTTYGRTLALDARTGAKLWEFVPGNIGSYQGTAQITTATPTADPNRRFVYATSPDGRVHKLAVANGRQVWSRQLTFDPTHEKLASPPTVSGKELIVVTDGYDGDTPPYQGHVVTMSLATGRIEHVWNSLCSNHQQLIQPSTCPASDSAIWGRAGAVLVPGSNDILVTTANGPFNGTTDWGDSVIELAPDGSQPLHNWTPTDQQRLNVDDLDLGSTSPALLPDPGGPPLGLQGGKGGVLDLLDLDRLDGTTGPAGPRTGGQLQELPDPGNTPMFTAPAVWVHEGRTLVFVATGGGTTEYVLRSGAHPSLSVGWQNGTAGTSPIVAGGLLYVYDPGGTLNVYAPTTGRRLASLAAQGGHWNSPIAIGGRVVLPVGNANDHATTGALYIWHLPGR